MSRIYRTAGETMGIDVALEHTRAGVALGVLKGNRTVASLRFDREVARDLALAILEAADAGDGVPWVGPNLDDSRKLMRQLERRTRYDRIGREIAAGKPKRKRKGKGAR